MGGDSARASKTRTTRSSAGQQNDENAATNSHCKQHARRALGDVSNASDRGHAQNLTDGHKVKPSVPRRSTRLRGKPPVNSTSFFEAPFRMRQAESNHRDDAGQPKSSKHASKIAGDESVGPAPASIVASNAAGPIRRPSQLNQRSLQHSRKNNTVDRQGACGSDTASAPKRERHHEEGEDQAYGAKKRKIETKRNPWCKDVVVDDNYTLMCADFDDSKYVAGIAPIDMATNHDVAFAGPYVTDIYRRLYYAESTFLPGQYIEQQPHLNCMMRAILIDWLVEVHMKFRLMPETLYLCINIIDRYLSLVQIPRQKLQLVGVTALLVACKYEELFPPEVKDCVYITDRAYSKEEVISMEAHIVKKLKFRFTVPTAFQFLQRFLFITKSGREVRNLANYYSERMLQEYSLTTTRPSLIAAAAVSLALNNPDILRHAGIDDASRPGIPIELLRYTQFTSHDITEAANAIASRVAEHTTTYSRRELLAVKRKFETSRYDSVSTNFEPPQVSHLGL